MPSSFEVLQSCERLRVGQRFLRLRPFIAAVGAVSNAVLLARSSAPAAQKLALCAALATMLAAFFVESWWLGRHRVSECWLSTSLGGARLH